MANALLSPSAKERFTDDDGTPLAGGFLYTYLTNSSTPATTYLNRAGTVANANPIVLDARGEAVIYRTPGVLYRDVLKRPDGSTVWTRDDVSTQAGDAAAIAFTQRGTGAVERTTQGKAQERVSVLDYIPTTYHAGLQAGTETADMLTYITAALTAAATLGKCELVFPAGDYRVSGAVQVTQTGLCIKGEGRARLVSTSTTANILEIGNGTGNPANIDIRGLAFTATSQKTAGAAIYVRNGNDIRIHDLIGSSNLFDGVVFEGGSGQFGYYLDRFLLTYFTGTAIKLQPASGGAVIQDVHITRGIVDGQGVASTKGLYFTGGGGTYVDGVDIIRCGTGVYTYPSTGNAVNYSFFDQVVVDSCVSHNWHLDDNGGVVLGWFMSNCWGNTAGGNGLYSAGSGASKIRNVQVVGGTFSNNGLNGVRWTRTDNHSLQGCTIGGNNTSNTAGAAGVYVDAPCTYFTIAGNIIDNTFFAATTKYQYYGIFLAAGASDYYSITGNTIRGSLTANLSDGGTGTNKVIGSNLGATPSAVAPTLTGGWSNLGGGTSSAAGYWKDADGIVHLRGTVAGSTGIGTANPVFTLPAGYRPALNESFPVVSNDAFGLVQVKSDGTVNVLVGSVVYATLNGITFRAA